jgi:hypothetical protein
MEPEKQIFFEACKRIVAERGINKAEIMRRTGLGRSLYGFLAYGRGMEDKNMNKLAGYLGFDSWVALVVAEQNAEQNGKREAETGTEGVKVDLKDIYLQLGKIMNQIEILNFKIDSHVLGGSNDAPGANKKKQGG